MQKQKKPELAGWLQGIADITQLGLSIVLPIVLCTWLASYLKTRFSLPDYVVLIGLLLGILSAANSAVRFAKDYIARINKTK